MTNPMRKKFAIGCILILVLSTSSVTATKRPPKDLDVPSRTILGITLGQSNLALVQEKLGAANLWGDGDGGNAESKVCYLTREPNSLVIIYAANSEMSPDHIVTNIRILKKDAYKDRSNCLPLTIGGDEVSTPNHLKIGSSREKVRAILGPPSRTVRSEWRYDWSVDRTIPKSDPYYQRWADKRQECFEGREPYFTASSDIAVQFKDDLVVALFFSRIDSVC
jgi:hypothetical protein